MPTAIVLTGGGSLGAVQVGMLQALSAYGVRPDLLVGTSSGAMNAAWVAGHGMSADSLAELASIWTALRRTDVFPVDPGRVVRGLLGLSSAVSTNTRLSRIVAGDGTLDGIAISGFAFLAGGINEVVGGLVLGGIAQLDFGATYGGIDSGATHIFEDYFKGSGVVTLIPEPRAAMALVSGLGVLVGAQRFRRRR